MDDKEKLIWLLCNAHSKSCEASAYDGISYAEQLAMEADFLLENRVTFATDNNVGYNPIIPGHDDQYNIAEMSYNNGYAKGCEDSKPKWIPVSERLPEYDLPRFSNVKQIKVLTALISDKGVRTVRSQMRYKDTWATGYQTIWRWKCSGSEITHWMPLPEPPKEK